MLLKLDLFTDDSLPDDPHHLLHDVPGVVHLLHAHPTVTVSLTKLCTYL